MIVTLSLFAIRCPAYFHNFRLCNLLKKADAALGSDWSTRERNSDNLDVEPFAPHLVEPEALELILQVI